MVSKIKTQSTIPGIKDRTVSPRKIHTSKVTNSKARKMRLGSDSRLMGIDLSSSRANAAQNTDTEGQE